MTLSHLAISYFTSYEHWLTSKSGCHFKHHVNLYTICNYEYVCPAPHHHVHLPLGYTFFEYMCDFLEGSTSCHDEVFPKNLLIITVILPSPSL